MRIFTKSFFRLSEADQRAVVDAVIRDFEDCLGRLLNPSDEGKVHKQIGRIRRRAIEQGVYLE